MSYKPPDAGRPVLTVGLRILSTLELSYAYEPKLRPGQAELHLFSVGFLLGDH